MNYNYQLKNISTQYRKFSKGQYVEHTQFNEFLDFFEDQDRLSRVMLHGVGIVCGFQPEPIYTNRRITSIKLSQGIAITTDGDLLTLDTKSKTANLDNDQYVSELKNINLDGKVYTHWKVYDNHKAMYPNFHDDSEDPFWLCELATSEEAKAGFQPLETLGGIENQCLLLYLESYEKEVKPCRGVDCDNHGIQQVRNLKVLVTSVNVIDQILNKDKVYPERVFIDKFIPDEKFRRVILNPKITSAEKLRNAFKEAVTSSKYGNMIINLEIISKVMNMPSVNRALFVKEVQRLIDQNKNFQYAYDAINDLRDTYSEIATLFPKSFTKCFPDLQSFPKHVLLGKIVSTEKLDYTRHQFYNSPVLDNKKTSQRLRSLIERFNQQTLEFKDPTSIGEKMGVKITPSQEISLLGDKAIPFYYNLTEKFLNFWNFDKTRNRVPNTNLSFDTTKLSSEQRIQKPLGFNMDRKPFYVIEGHQGLHYKEAVDRIRKIKDVEQLGIDVMALSLAQLRDNKDLSKANFSEYVEKHPGLEHIGGVKRGGTFAVVYESETNPIVIADFSLPYICCTPKANVALSLPADTICRDAAPMIFTVTPPNGVVEADVDPAYNGGVEIVNGQYLFNPTLVDNVLLNQEISFKVNGKPTNCKVRTISSPSASVRAVFFEYPEGDSTRTVVTFNVVNQTGIEYDYKWDFLGNGSYVSVKPDAKGDVKYTYFKIDPRQPVNVMVSANGCSQNITLKDWYVPQPIENNTPPTVTIRADHMELYLPENQTKLYSTVTAGNGTVNNYLWSCADSNVIFTSTDAATVGVTFPYAGNFTVSLTVRDTNNLTGTAFLTIKVGTKARITELILSPTDPTTNDEIIVEAVTWNPSNIGGLVYDWYLDGALIDQTISNARSFGRLNAGSKRIDVELSASDGSNHLNGLHTVHFTVKEPNIRLGTSFLEGTLITMDDGTKRAIEQIKAGDKLKGFNNVVRVVKTVSYTAEVDVYQLNDEKFFITGAHPVRTDRGWRSFEPEKTKEMIPTLDVELLRIEDLLLKEHGKVEPLQSVRFVSGQYKVYNLEVDGDKDYFANEYSVYSEI